MFFRLNPETRLVLGAKKGVVYDLIDNRMRHISVKEKSVLKLSEENEAIDEISKKLGIDNKAVSDILKMFWREKLGEFYEKAPYVEPLHITAPISKRAFFKQPPSCTNLFVELNNNCDYDRCSYCGANEARRVFGCMGCNVWRQKEEERMDIASYINVFDQASKLAFMQIFLTGGNVLDDRDKLSPLLDHLERMHFSNIFLILHEKQIADDDIDFISHYKNLNVVLNCDIPVSSKILKIVDNLKQNLLLMVVVDITKFDNREELARKTREECEKIDNKRRRSNVTWQIDYSSPNFINDYIEIPLFGQERVSNPNLRFFEWCQEHHPCLGGTLTVSSCGDVYVCRAMRKKSIGSIFEGGLHEVIRAKKDEIEELWNLTRDNITPCKDCEYRYSCSDCRAIEKDIYQTRLCIYDPYKGKWTDDLT